MKYCPKCQSTYTDATLQFCLQDGTQLISQTPGNTDSPTVSFEGDETIISSKRTDPITFDLNTSQSDQWQQSQATRVSNIPPVEKKSNTLLVVLLTALFMLSLFGLIGAGAWYYYNNQQNVVRNTAYVGNNTDNEKKDSGLATNSSKTPTKPKPSQTKTPDLTPTPTPDTNPEETKKNVAALINSWKSTAEAKNLSAYMNNYASTVDYYNKKGASRSFVQNDKQKAFNKYDTIKVQLSNINITTSEDGQTAVAVLDKEWDFSGEEKANSGKVQQQLKLKKNGELWQITSEKDLKVYYVNK